MENCEFCEDMSKSKNANRVIFLSRIMQNSRTLWTRDQNIDLYEEILFLGKIYCFYKKRN